MLCVLKSAHELSRLERSGRLLHTRFHDQIFALAADDLGDSLRYVTPSAAAAKGFTSPESAWTQIQKNLTARAPTLEVFGLAPFWFVDCPGWPPSAFLNWRGLHTWGQQVLKTNHPLMAASFSSDQLILGLANSGEFHNRLSHARQAPVERPLLSLPFLLNANALPTPIAKIDLVFGAHVTLTPHKAPEKSISFTLIEATSPTSST